MSVLVVPTDEKLVVIGVLVVTPTLYVVVGVVARFVVVYCGVVAYPVVRPVVPPMLVSGLAVTMLVPRVVYCGVVLYCAVVPYCPYCTTWFDAMGVVGIVIAAIPAN